MSYQIITHYEDLVKTCQAARLADTVMLDTEFVRIRTYHPRLGLIQLFDGTTTSLIDPVAISDLTPLAELLQDTSVLKVLHACGEDIEVFQHALGCVPTPMIDTQILAAFLGYGVSTGFAALVKEYVGVELDKSESRADWIARPLTVKQLDYAAADVIYLAPLYTALLEKVQEKGWWESALQESQLQIDKRLQTTPDELAYVDIKGAWSLKPRALATLQLLAKWRLHEAQRRDLALNFVIRENDLLQIARLELSSEQSMAQEGIDQMALKRHGRKLIQLVKQSGDVAEADYPAAIVPLNDYPGYKQLFKTLKDKVKKASEQSGLSPEFIASRKQINQLISHQWKAEGKRSEQLPDLMKGWRKELVGLMLQELIPTAPKM
ncbi:ribonuclease D [Vibrio sp. WJH972]